MSPENLKIWEKVREKGEVYFLITNGILKVGLLFASLNFLWSSFLADRLGFKAKQETEIGWIVFKFIFQMLWFGILMGLYNWHIAEKQYLKAKKNVETASPAQTSEKELS
jgi:hypothetical protein